MKISSGTLVLGVFAALFGLVGAYAAKQHLAEKPVESPEVQLVSVPMAAIDLPAGRTISAADVTVKQMTWAQIRAEGLPLEFLGKLSQLAGRTLCTSVAKGMPFAPEDLYPEGTGPSVAERLRPGYRAVSVPLDNSHAELALLSPGAVVDVLFRTFSKGAVPETTVTLLENVEIMAIGNQTFPGGKANVGKATAGRSATVTLACTPEQTSALKVVEGRGSLSLVLRGPLDDHLVQAPAPQTLESLLDLPEPKQAVTTQVYRRGRLTTSVFEDGKHVAVTEGFSGLPVAADTTRSNSVVPVSYIRGGADAAALAAADRAGPATAGNKADAGCRNCDKNK